MMIQVGVCYVLTPLEARDGWQRQLESEILQNRNCAQNTALMVEGGKFFESLAREDESSSAKDVLK